MTETISDERKAALTAASQAFCNRGLTIALPWEGDLDDRELELFDAMVAAIDGYNTISRRAAEGEAVAMNAVKEAIRKGLTDNLQNLETLDTFDVDVLLRGCQHALHSRGYADPVEAADVLATAAATAVTALFLHPAAATEVADEMVERAAIGMWRAELDDLSPAASRVRHAANWAEEGEGVKIKWRRHASAALTAALRGAS